MKGYKGFEKGLICKGKQYQENTVFEEDEAVICKSGMHFCENPFDVLDYYDLVNANGEMNEFAEVEALDEVHTDYNKKYCTKKLKIGAKLSFGGFVKACVDFIFEKTQVSEDEKEESGYSSQMANSGDSSQMASSGDYSKMASSGYSSKMASSGYYSQMASSGEDSVICCAGHNSVVKAKKGSWITLSEWKYSEEKERYVPICVKTEQVDGERIKEDTFYKLANGEFKEVKVNE